MTKHPNTATATTSEAPSTNSIAPLALRAREAAKVLGISERALWTATNAGQVPHVRVGRVTLYSIRALEEWLDEAEAALETYEERCQPQRMGEAHRSS